MNTSQRQKSKEKAKRFLIVLAVVFVVLLGLNVLSESGILLTLFTPKPDVSDPPYIYLYPADYEEDIFEDEGYLQLERRILYKDGAQSIYMANENDYQRTGDLAMFFAAYFNAIVEGDAEAYNALLSKGYKKEHGEKTRFTMQKLYGIEIVYCDKYALDSSSTPTTVYEFEVDYYIRMNNGTFRSDISSDTSRTQLYRLYQNDISDEITLGEILEYIEKG